MSFISHVPPSLVPSPIIPIGPWAGIWLRLKYNNEAMKAYHDAHWEEFNGLDVEYYEIYNMINSKPTDEKFMLIRFTYNMSFDEMKEFLGIDLTSHYYIVFDENAKLNSNKHRNDAVILYSYEGVKSGTKSAAKITKPIHT